MRQSNKPVESKDTSHEACKSEDAEQLLIALGARSRTTAVHLQEIKAPPCRQHFLKACCIVAFGAWLAVHLAMPAIAQTMCTPAQLAPLPGLKSAEGKFLFVTTLKRKPGVSDADFHTYLSDVHGGLAARLPGIDEYWQNHVAYDDGVAWPHTPGVSYEIAPEDRFDASNPAVFSTEEGFRKYFASTASIFLKDEQNLFQETIAYLAKPGNFHVVLDDVSADSLGLAAPRPMSGFLVMLQKTDGTDVQAFRDYLVNVLTPALADPALVSSLRLALFEPVDNKEAANASAANVTHSKPSEKQYQAAWEVVFRSPLAMSTLFGSAAYRATLAEQPRFIRAIHAYRLTASLAMIRGGRTTPVGLRGVASASLIERLGACNQLAPDVTDWFRNASSNPVSDRAAGN